MDHALLKEKVLSIIEEADDELLERIYSIVNDYGPANMLHENEEDLLELRKRTELRKQGISKTYSWDEAKKMILGQDKSSR